MSVAQRHLYSNLPPHWSQAGQDDQLQKIALPASPTLFFDVPGLYLDPIIVLHPTPTPQILPLTHPTRTMTRTQPPYRTLPPTFPPFARP